jgi:dTDP-4-amino-4,6-dideoxygalactose transaminase
VISEGSTSNYHLFVVRSKQRDQLQKYLFENGIETVIHYPVPPYLQNAYSYLNINPLDYPIANLIANTALSLPLYPGIDIKEIEYVCEIIKKFYA